MSFSKKYPQSKSLSREPKLIRRSGQAFTVEFAIAIAGVIALAFVSFRVSSWGLANLEQLSMGYQATRQAAGQEQANYVAPLKKSLDRIDLVGPHPGESAGPMASSPPEGVSFGTFCQASPGLLTQAIHHRTAAVQAVNGGKAALPPIQELVLQASEAYAAANLAKPIEIAIEAKKAQLRAKQAQRAAIGSCPDPVIDPQGYEDCKDEKGDLDDEIDALQDEIDALESQLNDLLAPWGASSADDLALIARNFQEQANLLIGHSAQTGLLAFADSVYTNIWLAEQSERGTLSACKNINVRR